MDEERIFEELQHILRVVDRMETILKDLEERAKMAMQIFKMVQDLDLLPENNFEKMVLNKKTWEDIPELKFRKNEK